MHKKTFLLDFNTDELYNVNMTNFKDGYYGTPLKNNITVTDVFTVHYFRYGRNFKFKGEAHNFWELTYIDSGNAKIVAGGITHSLKQGDVFLHKPNEWHNIYTDEEFANSTIVSFSCKSRWLKTIAGNVLVFSEYEKGLLNKIIHEAQISFSDKLDDIYLKKMNKSDNAPFGSEQVIKNCIELLLLSLIRKKEFNAQSVVPVSVDINSNLAVDKIKGMLTAKLDKSENVNLEEIAFNLGLSKSYVKQNFKKITGVSVIQYFINLKIDKSKKLLSQQKYSVTEIADQLGFSSIHYFSRQFKSRTGMSPSEYVNSIKADNLL